VSRVPAKLYLSSQSPTINTGNTKPKSIKTSEAVLNDMASKARNLENSKKGGTGTTGNNNAY